MHEFTQEPCITLRAYNCIDIQLGILCCMIHLAIQDWRTPACGYLTTVQTSVLLYYIWCHKLTHHILSGVWSLSFQCVLGIDNGVGVSVHTHWEWQCKTIDKCDVLLTTASWTQLSLKHRPQMYSRQKINILLQILNTWTVSANFQKIETHMFRCVA